jgi:hypothetical protein
VAATALLGGICRHTLLPRLGVADTRSEDVDGPWWTTAVAGDTMRAMITIGVDATAGL